MGLGLKLATAFLLYVYVRKLMEKKKCNESIYACVFVCLSVLCVYGSTLNRLLMNKAMWQSVKNNEYNIQLINICHVNQIILLFVNKSIASWGFRKDIATVLHTSQASL